MDLQEFIQQSLIQIAHAVRDVNQSFASESLDARVNPAGILHRSMSSEIHGSLPDTQIIEFDVAVTVTASGEETSSKKGSLALSIVGASVGKEKTAEQTNSSVSRLRFKIPLKLPNTPQ